MPDADSSRRPLALDDLATLRTVSDPRISPDGRQVAFVVETIDPVANDIRSQVWIATPDDVVPPRALTSGEKQDSQPRWSPDGRWLAFVSNRTGTSQVWVLPVAGGEPRLLTSHPIGVSGPTWSPDSLRLAFVAIGAVHRGDAITPESLDDRRRVVWVREHQHKLDGRGFLGSLRRQIWVVFVDDGAASQLTDGLADAYDPAWSLDGTTIAFVSDRTADRDRHFDTSAVHLVELSSGEVRRITPEVGRAARPSWSPDGAWIAYVGSDLSEDESPSNTRLWQIRIDATETRCLTADLDLSVGQRPQGYLTPSPPAWIPESNALLYLIGEGPSTHLYRISQNERVPLTSGRRVVHSFSIAASGLRAALLVSAPTTPAEIWLWDAKTGSRPITAINDSLLRQLSLASTEDRRIVRPDGTTIDGWLLRPTNPTVGRVPLILSVHGGPHNYFGDDFTFERQLYAAAGYAVLYVNPRGSGGSSEAFARAVCGDWGGEDFADLAAMVDDVLASEPWVDPQRVGITGVSYGGYMTCWAVTQTDRFAAAVAVAGISNLISFFGASDNGVLWGPREFGGTPYERRQWFLDRSPISHAPRVQTPLLLYHGDSDLRCPIEQSEQMFTALLRLGKTVEFLRLPGESHHGVVAGTPAHRIAGCQAVLDWFRRYLQS